MKLVEVSLCVFSKPNPTNVNEIRWSESQSLQPEDMRQAPSHNNALALAVANGMW